MQSHRTSVLVLVSTLAACGRSEENTTARFDAGSEIPTPIAARSSAPEAPGIDAPPSVDVDSRQTAVAPIQVLEPFATPTSHIGDGPDPDALRRLRAHAERLAESSRGDPTATLEAWSKAEDAATKMLDQVFAERNDEGTRYFTSQFREILEESNQFVASVFTPDYVERQPWRDLLSDTQRAHWQSYAVQDFRLEGGVLRVVGPARGAVANALIAVPDAGGYRDFELQMEFSLDGTVDLLFRLGRRVDNTVESYTLSTKDEDEPLKAAQSYVLDVKYIGNELTGSITPGEATLPEIQSTWTKSRRGAIGVQLHEAAKLTITSMRIRVLREFSVDTMHVERAAGNLAEQRGHGVSR